MQSIKKATEKNKMRKLSLYYLQLYAIFFLQKTGKTLKYGNQTNFIFGYLNLQPPELCYYNLFFKF